ncbi:hypothetical protein Pla108_23810 [Botrimarina colliarenosi]|uniref:Uncharacterized protein n=1 Tax=Botrimarina colliarenosi TaxID=2528001 RepID=A0A5C6A9D7_9BACT|nr:hypothetical protein [Botrimarina colliarenosi]TWT96612.1 hypothetical protein Pla108_23810 [Botrimarina colliarenosi]
MDFSERLKRATQRGHSLRAEKEFEAAADALSEEEQRRLHSQHRLLLTEHIEIRLRELADNLPGFKLESLVEDRGWGSGIHRDDLIVVRGKRQNFYSRLQLLVGPFNEFHVIDVTAKGAIRNKESFSRTHHKPIADFDEEEFRQLIDRWVLDYAEDYAAA